MPRSTLQSSTEDDTFAALSGTRVKFWFDPGFDSEIADEAWAELEKYFLEDYGIPAPTKDNPLFLAPNNEYSHMLIMVGQIMGRLRYKHHTLFVFFINHEHGY